MTDFEGRLRAAMEATVDSEQPPGNLVEMIRRRHRRHTARLAVAGIAVLAAAAAAVPPAGAALLGGGAAATHAATRAASPTPGTHASRSAPVPHAASGTGQYYGCDSQTDGGLGPHWRRGSTQAGPLWFINKGIAPSFKFHNPDGSLKAVPIIVMLRDNTTARVRPSGAGTRYFRFLSGFNSTNHYTLRDGEAGATFVGCSGQNSMHGSAFTEFYLGIIVAGPRCITLEVRTPASKRPVPATLSFGKCRTGN